MTSCSLVGLFCAGLAVKTIDLQCGKPMPLKLPKGYESGTGAERDNAQAAKILKRLLRAKQSVTDRIEVHVLGPAFSPRTSVLHAKRRATWE